MRRSVTITLSLSLSLVLTASLFAQGDKPKDAKPETATKDAAAKPAEAKPAPAEAKPAPAEAKPAPAEAKPAPAEAKPAPAEAKPAPPKTIPPEVQAKLEAARKAVAEAIVAAEDAGLVQTTLEQPPILDILINGRADDVDAVKNHTGVSPEVFGAWYTGYGKLEGFTAEKDVRIVNPSAGLKSWYDQRAAVLTPHLMAARKAKTDAAKAVADAKVKEEEAKKKAAMEAEAKKKADDEAAAKKKADDDKKDDSKKDDDKKSDEKKDDDKSKS